MAWEIVKAFFIICGILLGIVLVISIPVVAYGIFTEQIKPKYHLKSDLLFWVGLFTFPFSLMVYGLVELAGDIIGFIKRHFYKKTS